MRRNKWLVGALALLLLLGAVGYLTIRNQPNFQGSRVRNPDAYLLDIRAMNGTDLHTLELQKDDVLDVLFETTKGAINLEIKGPDGATLYCGNGRDATSFTLNIPDSGVYRIMVEARHAKGTLHIQLRHTQEADGAV